MSAPNPKLYLAGPMRGYPEHNFSAFDAAAYELRKVGYDVVSPAELDRVNGIHEFTVLDPLPAGLARVVMKRDCAAICDCDGIALLEGWDHSRGVVVECALANFLHLDILDVSKWLSKANENE